jgi:hypothetical protein
MERQAGLSASRRRYRHTRLRDGGWEIEEVTRQGADSLSSSGGTSFSHLELSSAFDVLKAELRTESFGQVLTPANVVATLLGSLRRPL